MNWSDQKRGLESGIEKSQRSYDRMRLIKNKERKNEVWRGCGRMMSLQVSLKQLEDRDVMQ